LINCPADPRQVLDERVKPTGPTRRPLTVLRQLRSRTGTRRGRVRVCLLVFATMGCMTGGPTRDDLLASASDAPEVALASVMAARSEAALPPPLAAPPLLPFGSLSVVMFERLVAEVVLYVDGLGRVRVYGRSGQAQGGLDLIGGSLAARSVYQVRRIKELTPAALRKAVTDYAGPPARDGARPSRRFDASRFVLVTGCEVDDTHVEDELHRLEQEYAGDLEIALYDAGELSRRLRERGALVAGVFGPEWAKAFCGWERSTPPVEPEARLLLNDPVVILGFDEVLRQADDTRDEQPAAAAEVYRSVAEVLDDKGMAAAGERIGRRHRDALEAAGDVHEAFRVGMNLLLRRYDADEDDADHCGVLERLAAAAGPAEHDAAVVGAELLQWAASDLASADIVAALEVLADAGHRFAIDLATRVAEQVITDDDNDTDVAALHGILARLFALCTDETMTVRLRCASADLAVRLGSDPVAEFAPVLAAARGARFADGPAALVHRRAAHALARSGRTGEASELYRASVVHAGHAGLGGDARDALRALAHLTPAFSGASTTAEAARAVGSRRRLLPGANQAALATLELMVEEDKLPAALRRARQWVRHERVSGALLDELVARRRLGTILDRAGEHAAAAEEFVRAGDRKAAGMAAAASAHVPVTHYLRDGNADNVRAAAADVVAAQADVVPDDDVPDHSAQLLSIVETGPKVTFAGPARVQHALGALAALVARLPAAHADRLVELLGLLVPRGENRYRFTDTEMVNGLAGLAARTDIPAGNVAGRLLVDAVQFQVAQAPKALQRLATQESLVPALAKLAGQGNADAAEVLATWNVWVEDMTLELKVATDCILAAPVGQPRDSYGVGHAAQHGALLLDTALGRPGAEDDTTLVNLRDRVAAHLLAWASDRYDIAASRRTAVDGLICLTEKLPQAFRHRACETLLAEYDTPLTHPGDEMEQRSLHPLSTFRMNTGSWLFPLACLRAAAHLASTPEEINAIQARLALAIQRTGDDPGVAGLAARAVLAIREHPPLPIAQLAAHPAAPIRQTAAVCWAADPDKDLATASALARDETMLVRQHIAFALFGAAGKEPTSSRYTALLKALREDDSYAVRRTAAGIGRR